MPARLHPNHAQHVRQKIQASNIITRLYDHVEGKVQMSATQITAAIALLDRSVPKLQQIQHVGEVIHKIDRIETVVIDPVPVDERKLTLVAN